MEPEQPPHQDSEMADADMQVEGNFDNEDEYDNTPAFVGEGDAVEVQVDDDNAPMEDDYDDDAQDDGGDDIEEEIVDMAKVVIPSHSDPVYAIGCTLNTAVANNTSNNSNQALLRIVSGGGDDKAFWHEVALSSSPAAAANTTDQFQFQVQTWPLEHLHTFKDSVSAIADNSPFIAFDATKPPNPEWMAVGALDGSIVLYGPNNNNQVQLLEGPTSDIEFLCWHPKGGNVVLAGSSDATLWMYHTSLKKCLQVFVGHEDSVTCGCFSADGKVAVSGSADGTVRIWAPKTGKSKHVFRFDNTNSAGGGPPPALTCMVTHGGPDRQLIMVGSEDGQAHICHIANKKHVASLRHYDPTANAINNNNNNIPPQGNGEEDDDEEEEVFLPSGVEAVGFCKSNPHWCATGGMDGVLKIWDLANQGQVRHTCQAAAADADAGNSSSSSRNNGAGNGITKLEWHPTLPLVITSNCRGRIHLWDARNGQLLETLTGHRDVINDMGVVFVPSASAQPTAAAGHALIVTGSDDHTVRVFDLDIDAALAKAPQQILA